MSRPIYKKDTATLKYFSLSIWVLYSKKVKLKTWKLWMVYGYKTQLLIGKLPDELVVTISGKFVRKMCVKY